MNRLLFVVLLLWCLLSLDMYQTYQVIMDLDTAIQKEDARIDKLKTRFEEYVK